MKYNKAPDPHKSLTDKEWESMGKTMYGINELPEAARKAALRLRGRPKAENPKVSITARLDSDVLAALKARGKGWQTVMNDVLKQWAKTHPA